ncbi:hypothetical protein V8C43DRAFT_321673 [Trichoderma afarasin]|uniref:EthD domain-containing protein n=2 Tax=Trichoderma TaxID=5543 RepID=A0A2T4ABR2_TRIHA|nr:hypothetical protein M431DRAFT_481676 [Trichoderma harzianum CBS 226.95]KAK0762740.1 hypothetical protein N5P37_005558 [Trichoderma harzianum]QYS97763.1 EthD domain-containing protein [Trichoderma simmonsii]KAK4066837.1 hypothetical protein Trihar35433_7264 [Trichoderma harzianum]PKK52179.1 hypothetical protein CI102_2494 [Trichoderma harzianum]PTB54443.1 hypothetical protein M431DRAFT_481676 [Trichoderma harzianum CBS 226.95]
MSDNKSASIPLSGVWRATVSARRKEGLTKEEFSRRFARHGTLAGPVVVKHNGISYLQHHLTDTLATKFKEELGPQLAPHFPIAEIDGITTLIFPTAKDLAAFFADPAHNESLNADVAEFADVTSVQFSVGDELAVVQDGKLLL